MTKLFHFDLKKKKKKEKKKKKKKKKGWVGGVGEAEQR